MQLQTLIKHLHLSGVWLGADLKNGHQKYMYLKVVAYMLKNH